MRSLSPGAKTKSSPKVLYKSRQVELARPRTVPPDLSAGASGNAQGPDQGSTPGEGDPRTSRIIERAQRQADELLTEAGSKARTLGQWSLEKAKALCKESQDRGYRLGMAQAEREITEKVDALMRLIEGAVRARHELLRRTEPEVIELAVSIAEKVIGQELTRNPAIVADMARRALERTGKSGTYYLRVNPADAEIVSEYVRRDLADTRCEVVADDRIEEGGCVIVTTHGHVDAQVGSQLSEVRSALLGEGDTRDH